MDKHETSVVSILSTVRWLTAVIKSLLRALLSRTVGDRCVTAVWNVTTEDHHHGSTLSMTASRHHQQTTTAAGVRYRPVTSSRIDDNDVRDDSQLQRLIDEVRSFAGDAGINLFINNAGICDKTISSLNDVTKENLMSHFETNVVAPVLLTKAMLPLLKQAVVANTRDGGDVTETSAAILNISSTMGCQNNDNKLPIYMPYRISKAGLNKVTHCLSVELEPDHILVTSVHPGWVRTDMGTQSGLIDPEDSVHQIVNGIILHLGPQHRGKLFLHTGIEVST